MTETDQLGQMRGVGQGESPGRPPGRPMRQLEFSQAMSDFCYMFPETDEDVIEAVLRANNGMVDATIDQLLTMNIDVTDEDDDLSDRILLSLERDIQQQRQSPQQSASGGALAFQQMANSRRSGRESKSSRKIALAEGCVSDKPVSSCSKDHEDCPPSYTEAVQSHALPSHHHRTSNGSRGIRHRHSPTISRQALGTMQHLLDLGPDTAPSASVQGAPSNGGSPVAHTGPLKSHHHRDHHVSSPSSSLTGSGHSHHHHHHHFPRTSASANHHRRRWVGNGDGSSGDKDKEKSLRPGRNLLASSASGHHHHHHHHSSTSPHHHHHTDGIDGGLRDKDECCRGHHKKGSYDTSNDLPLMDNGYGGGLHEKSPHRWRSSHRGVEFTNVKRPAYKNWNPPLLGNLPDDFLRITTAPPLPSRQNKHGTHLHRTMSAVGPQRPQWYPSSPSSMPSIDPVTSLSGGKGSANGDGRAATFSGVSQHSKSKASGSQKPHRSLSFAGNTGQARSSQPEFGPGILQERMKENERRRRMTSMDLDPQMTMYLEDERLALILQNSEFLQELRGDRMFMLTLERDQKMDETERPKRDPSPEATQPIALPEDDDRDFIEGYGDDRQNTLEAFPFSQQLPPQPSEDVELRKKLKNMGKASRKQFATLARKFFLKRRKKTAQHILRGTQAPSMVNLLDEDEEDIEEEFTQHIRPEDIGSDSYNQNDGTLHETLTNSSTRKFDVV